MKKIIFLFLLNFSIQMYGAVFVDGYYKENGEYVKPYVQSSFIPNLKIEASDKYTMEKENKLKNINSNDKKLNSETKNSVKTSKTRTKSQSNLIKNKKSETVNYNVQINSNNSSEPLNFKVENGRYIKIL